MTKYTTNATTQDIPYGYCHCGCGQKTNLAPQSDKRKGWTKGEPMRFVFGHQQYREIEPPNPDGLCMCGCGQKTNLAAQSHSRFGYVKGEPIRYIMGHQMLGRTKGNRIELFWENVPIGDPDACWEWQGGTRYNTGYGAFRINGRQSLTHRISYELTYGPIPDGLHVCHHCDNPPCVNPHHLFLGTHADNMGDMARKGRAPAPGKGKNGESHPNATVTDAIARAILERHAQGERQNDLAREYKIGKGVVHRIVRRVSWKHI